MPRTVIPAACPARAAPQAGSRGSVPGRSRRHRGRHRRLRRRNVREGFPGRNRSCEQRRRDVVVARLGHAEHLVRAEREHGHLPRSLAGGELAAGATRRDADLDHATGHRGAEAGRLCVQRQDPVVQSKRGSGPISGPIQNFDGACLPFGPPCEQPSGCSCLPPDTNGEVGATQYVQMVNTDFTVFSKTGTVLRGATPIKQLWANTDGECKTHNDGDPVVVYDQLAKRWLLSQFIVAGADEEYGECIAVSTTSDATGSYYLYEFRFGDISPATFHDYPKLGVWPDGYYMSSNEFPDGQLTSSGASAFAFERSKMLVGQPARMIYFDEAPHNPPGGQYSSRATSTARRSRRPGHRTSSRRSTIRPRSRRRRPTAG